jgi:tryptophanyl-tRNA synthetase
MHLGHKMVIDQVIYYQSVGADVFIGVADIEAFATRGYTLKDAKKLALEEYILNYIALGLKPCKIYFQSQQNDVKDLGYLLAKKANWSEVTAIYGFTGSTNMSHIFSPFIQCGDILHVQMMKYGGARPTLVPVGVDQDPHIRFTRGIAQAHRLFNVTITKDGRPGVFVKSDENIEKLLDVAENMIHEMGYHVKCISKYKALYFKDNTVDMDAINDALAKLEQKHGGYGFLLPSATFHRFMTGLTGDKMSSSKPQTAIFLTDTPEDARKKIMGAKTGGAVTLEEQKKHGGNPHQCVIYELFLYHLIQDDTQLRGIYEKCRNGSQRCGDCKSLASNSIATFLETLQEKREISKEKISEYIQES